MGTYDVNEGVWRGDHNKFVPGLHGLHQTMRRFHHQPTNEIRANAEHRGGFVEPSRGPKLAGRFKLRRWLSLRSCLS